MNAEIIAVGSEMLTPDRVDTNSLYLTGQLNALGLEVTAKHVIGDDRERLASAVASAAKSVDLIILTGGLGPTEDDVTRDAVAAATGRTLAFHQEIADRIEQRFRFRRRAMPEINKRQAYILEGAETLENDHGTAPGQWLEHDGRVMVLLPGPPNEMKPMFEERCVPRLERMLPPQAIRVRILRIAGMPESEVDQLAAPVYTRYTNPVTTILAAGGDIQLHLRARAAGPAEAERLVEEVAAQIEAILGDRIYSCNGDAIEAVIGERLRARGETLSVAESCTGGMLGERLTSVPGSSEYFVGGLLTYNDRMKTALAGVSEGVLRQYTAVSAETAEALAEGVRARTGSQWAISVTGVAGPGGGTEAAPTGTVYIAIAGPDGCRSHHLRFTGDRARVRMFATQTALDLLRRRLV